MVVCTNGSRVSNTDWGITVVYSRVTNRSKSGEYYVLSTRFTCRLWMMTYTLYKIALVVYHYFDVFDSSLGVRKTMSLVITISDYC